MTQRTRRAHSRRSTVKARAVPAAVKGGLASSPTSIRSGSPDGSGRCRRVRPTGPAWRAPLRASRRETSRPWRLVRFGQTADQAKSTNSSPATTKMANRPSAPRQPLPFPKSCTDFAVESTEQGAGGGSSRFPAEVPPGGAAAASAGRGIPAKKQAGDSFAPMLTNSLQSSWGNMRYLLNQPVCR